MLWSLLLSPASATDAPIDLGPAMAEAKKPTWEPKGKALEPYGRGDTKADADVWAEALPLLNESLTAQPGCGKCLQSLGEALVGMDHPAEALQVAERMIALFPEHKEGVWLKIEALEAAHRVADEVAALDAYLALDKASLTAWYERNHLLSLLGRESEALAKLEGAKVAGLKDADIACMKTDAQLMSGDLAGARETFVKCDATDSLLAMRRTVEGWLLVAEGDNHGAQGKFSQGGVELESRMTLAFVRLDEGKHDQALNLASKLMEDAPWALDPHLVKARALVGLNRKDEAEAALKAVLLADGWQAAHPKATRDLTILASRSSTWGQEVGAQALATQIALLVAKGDAAGAQALHDEAVKVHATSADLFAKALKPAADATATP